LLDDAVPILTGGPITMATMLVDDPMPHPTQLFI
jgi:hypothetical protein